MKFSELTKVIRPMLDSGQSIELVSGPGLGKSEYVEQVIKDQSAADGQEWGFSTMFLATQTPPDLVGYIFKGERKYGEMVVPVSEAAMPGWMFTNKGLPVVAHDRGILFLDEYGQGEADVKRASAELLLNRKLGPWKLPDGWSVIAASNRAKDRSGVTKSFDFVINRRVEVHITPDLESWLDYAVRNKVNPVIQTFAKTNIALVFNPDPPKEQGPWCTPRSLVKCGAVLEAMGASGVNTSGARGDFAKIPTGPIAQEVARGWLGDAAAMQLMNMIRLSYEAPTYEEIVANPEGIEVPGKPDICMLVMYNLASRVDEGSIENVLKFMGRMGKEYSTVFTQMALRRNLNLMRVNSAMRNYVLENKTLLAGIGAQR